LNHVALRQIAYGFACAIGHQHMLAYLKAVFMALIVRCVPGAV
jgi:hypothetical protein